MKFLLTGGVGSLGRRLATELLKPKHRATDARAVELRDEHVDARLTKMGYKVLRFPYKPPLTKKMLREIVDKIMEESVGKGRVHA